MTRREAQIQAVMSELATSRVSLPEPSLMIEADAETAFRRLAERCLDARDRVLPLLRRPPAHLREAA